MSESIATSADNAAAPEAARAWVQRSSPQMMLALHFAGGDRVAFEYFHLISPSLHGSILKMHFLNATVTNHGRHHEGLYDHIATHTAAIIREKHESEFSVGTDAPYIERIEVGRPDIDGVAHRPQR